MATVRDGLIRARALIDTPDKWIQRDFRCEGARCAFAALKDAGVAPEDRWPVYEAAGCSSLIVWNDARGRTHDEVLAAFDKAIASV